MTEKVELGPQLRQQVLETNQRQVDAIVNASLSGAVSIGSQFVFFAAFDGTNNDLENHGNRQNTNVAQLFQQAQSAGQSHGNLKAHYYPGPGTKGALTHSAWLDTAVTQQVIKTAQKAYDDFAVQASTWLKMHPGSTVAAVLTSFSRGGASAAIFSQMLYEKGLVDPNPPRSVLIQPGQVRIAAGVIYDPVVKGAKCNLAYAPNAGNIVVIQAQDEYRYLFQAADYSGQPGATTVGMLGNHCDIGGGYDNGIAALALQAATAFFQGSGLPIDDVEIARRFVDVDAIAIHDERVDDEGHPLWETYASFESAYIENPSPRGCVQVGTPATPVDVNGATMQSMALYNGHTIVLP